MQRKEKNCGSGRLFLLACLLLLALHLPACAGRDADTAEPEVKVRGQYDISIGTVR